jgi:hypothetical protein
MRIRPRFSLRTLFALTAICAALLAWRQSALNWNSERWHAIRWTHIANSWHRNTLPVIVGWRPYQTEVPLSLRIWASDTFNVLFVHFSLDYLSPGDVHWIDDFRRLFPEAEVTAKTAAEWRSEQL